MVRLVDLVQQVSYYKVVVLRNVQIHSMEAQTQMSVYLAINNVLFALDHQIKNVLHVRQLTC
jgi:uncharacterized protein with HEPN domain